MKLKSLKEILKEQLPQEPWEYPGVGYGECTDTIPFEFTLNGENYSIKPNNSAGVSWWDQDGDGTPDPPPEGYLSSLVPDLPQSGILLSLLMNYMEGNSSALNDYSSISSGMMCCTDLAAVTEGMAQNIGQLFNTVYPNLLGSLNNDNTVNSNALDLNPLVMLLIPETSSIQFTSVAELQSMIDSCTKKEKITCYQCKPPNQVVSQQFPGKECPNGWTEDSAPCNELTPNPNDGIGTIDPIDPKKKLQERFQKLAGIKKPLT
jgi:hypothetical protein